VEDKIQNYSDWDMCTECPTAITWAHGFQKMAKANLADPESPGTAVRQSTCTILR